LLEVAELLLHLLATGFEAALLFSRFGFLAAAGFFGGALAAFLFESFPALAFELGAAVFGTSTHGWVSLADGDMSSLGRVREMFHGK
jgi:hypothetical protein